MSIYFDHDDLLDKWEENHDINGKPISSFLSFNRKTQWSTELKAFLRSVYIVATVQHDGLILWYQK